MKKREGMFVSATEIAEAIPFFVVKRFLLTGKVKYL